MSIASEYRVFCTLQRFAPDPNTVYTLDAAAHLAGMPRHLVLVCCKLALVSPLVDPAYGGYAFDLQAIRTLQRIEYLRNDCGINLAGIAVILRLWNEVEHLRGSAGTQTAFPGVVSHEDALKNAQAH